MMLVQALGFSNGCAELALKKPPPLVPSSLIASWLATGPSEMVCLAPSRSSRRPSRQRLRHAERDEDKRDHDRERQQDVEGDAGHIDPEIADRRRGWRAKARTSATAIAMPAAADRKLWTVSPSICVRWLIVVSPE